MSGPRFFLTLRRRVVCHESRREMESYCFTVSVKASLSSLSISCGDENYMIQKYSSEVTSLTTIQSQVMANSLNREV